MHLAEPDIARKLAALADPATYPDHPSHVAVVETHMSWVFLTERHAYKLKKPRRLDGIDLSTVAARERHCRLETRLNRRFGDSVYQGVVALRERASGALALGAEGRAVDWLVAMRRLPRHRMLDALIEARLADRAHVRQLGDYLGRFYAMCPREPLDGAEVRAHVAARIVQSTRDLAAFPHAVPHTLAQDIAARQLDFLEREAALFDRRAADGHVVEGHGDLRPEHIALEAEPAIIDCLEFSRELRTVDPAEELGFLSMECERLGASWIRDDLFEAYAAVTGDRPPRELVDFYQSLHAAVRARLAIRHLLDPLPRDPSRWAPLARDYLRLAAEHLAAIPARGAVPA